MGTQRKTGRDGGASVAMERNESEVQEILDRLAEAVTEGNGKAVAKMWAVPALVLGDTMARPVSTLLEVEQFFGGAKEQYNARGISDTRADKTGGPPRGSRSQKSAGPGSMPQESKRATRFRATFFVAMRPANSKFRR